MIAEIYSGNYTRIFNVKGESFLTLAKEIFTWQVVHNPVYGEYCSLLRISPSGIESLRDIPFLPISLFKTHAIKCFEEAPQKIFTSSGTTGAVTSRHLVKDLSLYESSFMQAFGQFYGNPSDYAFLCLLPSYLEREGSSLIYMAQRLIEASGNADSGFFLHAGGQLMQKLRRREAAGLKTILLGVTFALMDFAEMHPMALQHTVIMDTGGMKGRKRELTRAEVHQTLKSAFQVSDIHSEYGMTELMSQAYSMADGRYHCPPWLKMFVRSQDDPFEVSLSGTGLLCVMDLANVHSCAFIETADLGTIYGDGSFEILGRMDHSDIRGCSLLTI